MNLLISDYANLIQEMCTITLLAIVLLFNLPVIVSSGLILRSKVQPWTTHMFLGNLALADLLHGVVCVLATQLVPNINHERVVCLLVMGLANSYMIECSLSVCLITFDRYIYINHCLYYTRWMTTERVRYTLAATWTFSLAVGLGTELLFGNYSGEGCPYFGVTPFFGLILIGFLGLIPNLITVLLYVFIFITAFKVGKTKCKENLRKLNYERNNLNNSRISNIQGPEITFGKIKETSRNAGVKDKNEKSLLSIDPENRTGDNISSDEYNEFNLKIKNTKKRTKEKKISYRNDLINKQKVNEDKQIEMNKNSYRKCNYKLKAKSMLVVFLVMSNFTVSWGPCFVCLIVYALVCDAPTDSDVCASLENVLEIFTLFLGLFNAILNPVIYCWWHKGFRKSFLKIFCGKKIREKHRRDFVSALRKQKVSEKGKNLVDRL